jgi:hypothetical protein
LEWQVGQLTVRTRTLLVPPLEQPRLPVLPAGVCTVMLKLPGAGINKENQLAEDFLRSYSRKK